MAQACGKGKSWSTTANGMLVCTPTVATNGTWTCTPTSNLPLGAVAIVATSGGAMSGATLNVLCSADPQCVSGQVCNTTSGACVTPACRGNAGAGLDLGLPGSAACL